MPENDQAGAENEQQQADAQAAQNTDQASTDQAQAATTDSGADSSAAQAEIDRLARRHKAAEKRVADLEAKLKADEDAKLSELEKAQRERDEERAKRESAEQRARDVLLQAAIERKAAQAGFADPADAVQFASKDDLLAEDGTVNQKAVEQEVARVLEAKPYLKSGQQAQAAQTTSATNGQRQGGTLTKAQLEKMSAEQIAEFIEADPANEKLLDAALRAG